MEDDKVQNNLRKSKTIILISNCTAALLFFIGFLLTWNVWLLIPAVLLIGSGILTIYMINNMQSKITKKDINN